MAILDSKVQKRAIGVFGGTFDPIHYGHLRTALEVHQQLHLNTTRFIPCGIPPHRALPEATAQQRLAMVQLAITTQPLFSVDEREINRPEPAYMVDTLTELRRELADTPLVLILGQDAFQQFHTWKNWQYIPQLAHLAIMARPHGSKPINNALQALLAERENVDINALHRQPAGLIFHCPVSQLDISASAIRDIIKHSRSNRDLLPHYLLPEVVLEYIEQTGLYR